MEMSSSGEFPNLGGFLFFISEREDTSAGSVAASTSTSIEGRKSQNVDKVADPEKPGAVRMAQLLYVIIMRLFSSG